LQQAKQGPSIPTPLANPMVMELCIKGIQDGSLQKVVNLYIGCTNNNLYPIAAMMAYLVI